MAATYAAMIDAKRRDGQRESAERLGAMTRGPGAPSPASMRLERAEAPREPSAGASIKPAVAAPAAAPMPPMPQAGFYRGDGGYEYIVGPQGEITIAASKYKRGVGKVVEPDSPFYDDIAAELATKTPSTTPDLVRVRVAQAQAQAPEMRTKKAVPKGVAVADVENVEIESAMAPATPAPMPTMAGTSYGSAQRAVPLGSKMPPPPTQAPRRGSRALSGEVGAVLSDYRSGVQLESNARSVIDGLVRNKMDPQAAKALVDGLRAQGPAGAEALRSLAGGFFDERIMVATGRK
jgi:hypothetical protein